MSVGRYKLKDKHGHILKSYFPPRQVMHYYKGMPVAADDDYPIPSAYTFAEVTGVDDDVNKCTTESVKEAHKSK